jgi:hypothetical protein
MTARIAGARMGRPSFAGVQASLSEARESNLRLIEANTNLALELREARRAGIATYRQIAAAAEYLAEPVHAEQTFNVVRVAQSIAAAAHRGIRQMGSVVL